MPKKWLLIFELIAGLLVLVGIGGAAAWFGYESLQLRETRKAVEEKLSEYQQAADQYASKQAELNLQVEKLKEPLKNVLSLHEKFKTFEVVEKTAYGRREQVIVRGAGQVFLWEDFSNFRLGDLPAEWGVGVAVAGNSVDHYLHGMSSGNGLVRKQVDFPQNFSFQFNFHNGLSSDIDWDLSIKDVVRKSVVLTKRDWGYFLKVQLTGAETVELDKVFPNPRGWHLISLEFWGNTVRLEIDHIFISSARLSGYKNFTSFEISCPRGWNNLNIDNFIGTDLGEEVKPKK